MAKLKIKGSYELLTVPDSEAKALYDDVKNKVVKKTDFTDIGRYHGEIGNITQYFFDSDEDKPVLNQAAYDKDKDQRERDRLARQPAEYKAKHVWGHFTLTYWGIYHTAPDKSVWQTRVESAALEFFTKNPHWTNVSLKCWFTLLGIVPTEKNKVPDALMDSHALRILSRVEDLNLREVAVRKLKQPIIKKSITNNQTTF